MRSGGLSILNIRLKDEFMICVINSVQVQSVFVNLDQSPPGAGNRTDENVLCDVLVGRKAGAGPSAPTRDRGLKAEQGLKAEGLLKHSWPAATAILGQMCFKKKLHYKALIFFYFL